MRIPALRIGYGYDIHRLESLPPSGNGRPFLLGGIEVTDKVGPVAVTDGDVLMHAITDALLGAIGIAGMGELFEHDDPRKRLGQSLVYLLEACERVRTAGWLIQNIDTTVILERPRLRERLSEIRTNLASLIDVNASQLTIKVKTHEAIGELGAGRAVEVHACALLACPGSDV